MLYTKYRDCGLSTLKETNILLLGPRILYKFEIQDSCNMICIPF